LGNFLTSQIIFPTHIGEDVLIKAVGVGYGV